MRKRFTEKLAEKLADVKNAFGRSKIAKRVATLSLAAGMLLPVAFAASGCQVIIRDPNNPDKDIVVDINPGTNPGDGDNKDPDEPSKEPDYSMYSPTLQTVLKSEYYNSLIENGNQQEYTFDTGYNLVEAIPYNFLEQKGENLQLIKDGRAGAHALLYTFDNEENNLYSRVELTYDNEGTNDVLKQYLIKYDLSEYPQEFAELKMLYQGQYAQANFLFQEIDKQIDPSNVELISEFGIYKNAYKQLLNSLNSFEFVKENFGKKIDNYTITSFVKNPDDERNYDLTLNLMSESDLNIPLNQKILAELKITAHTLSGVTYSNGIINWSQIHGRYINEKISASSPITCYYQIPTAKSFVNTIKQ